jgi:Asp-tRNA(Asn)/Glu-tRNA(Gln) amidotransferase A subunit family amidase
VLKDNVETGDRMHTSAGSLAMADYYAAEDAFLVRKLREAGAVILGKANMTEWANYMTENMTAGYSSRGGQVVNPYGRGKIHPGGSSAGSGVAVAANLTAVAVGTETSGSILSPAVQNAVVGIKPTVGLISRTGIIPLAHSQDTAGPMARTVEDAAILLGCLAGADSSDPATGTSAQHAAAESAGLLYGGEQSLEPSSRALRTVVSHNCFFGPRRVLFLFNLVLGPCIGCSTRPIDRRNDNEIYGRKAIARGYACASSAARRVLDLQGRDDQGAHRGSDEVDLLRAAIRGVV